MSDKNDIRIDVVGNADGFHAPGEAEKELNGLRDAAQKTGGSLNDLAKNALPRVADEVAAVTGASHELVMGVAALGTGFVAASLGGIALYQALAQGHEETLAMNRALAVSGGYAGQTRQDMLDLSRAVSDVGTVTVGQSKAIVTALVSSGQIAAESIGQIAGLAENYAAMTGVSIDKIGPQLVKLFADPAKGAEDLNKSLHFLSSAQLEHIQMLEEMGRKGEAQLELSNRLKDVLPEHAKELTYLGTIWANTEKVASRAWDAMLGVGREAALGQRLKDAQETLKNSSGWWNQMFDSAGKVAVLQAQVDKENADKEGKAAAARLQEREAQGDAMLQQYSKTAKKMALAKKMAAADSLLPDGAGKSEVLASLRDQIIGLDKEKAGPKGRSAKAAKPDDSVFQGWYSGFKEREKAAAALEKEQVQAEALIATYGREDAMTVQRIARSAELALMTERERGAAEAVYAAEDKSARRQEQIIKQIGDEATRTAALTAEKEQLAAQIERVREASLASYDAQKTFDFGWTKAFQSYTDEATNAATQGQQVFTSAADMIADAGTRLAMRQKVSFGDIAQSFAQMVIQMQMKAAAAGLVNSLGGLVKGMFSSGATMSGAGTSTENWIDSGGLAGARAGGGPVAAGKTYLVGEKGPELLRMGSSGGSVVPNEALGGGGVVVNMSVINQGAADGYQAQSSVKENNGKLDVEVLFVKAMQNDLRRNGPMTQGIGQAFGLRRSVG